MKISRERERDGVIGKISCCLPFAATFNGVSVPQLIGSLQSRDKTSEMQMAAAKCLTFLHRGGAIPATDNIIALEVKPFFLMLCLKIKKILPVFRIV